jgi:hypothetical protein
LLERRIQNSEATEHGPAINVEDRDGAVQATLDPNVTRGLNATAFSFGASKRREQWKEARSRREQGISGGDRAGPSDR